MVTRPGIPTICWILRRILGFVHRKPVRYRDAGVNIDEADRAVAAIKKLARQTFTAGVLTDIGSFGAMYHLAGFRKPVLVSSADGVGTKLKVAFLTGRHDTVGEDLVNHCVNDIAVQGAVPLFFLDYFAVGKLDAEVAAAVVSGIARGCRQNGCALIGGETAEMPGLYAAGEYDLAGFIVGAAERCDCSPAKSIREGDVLLACLPPACTPTAIRWRASCCSSRGYGPKTLLPELGCDGGRRTAQGASQLSEADPRADAAQGCSRRGAHHRRRHHRQHAAHAAQGLRRRSTPSRGRYRRCSS